MSKLVSHLIARALRILSNGGEVSFRNGVSNGTRRALLNQGYAVADESTGKWTLTDKGTAALAAYRDANG